MKKLKALYDKLPKEVKVLLEYILPSAIVTALIGWLSELEIDNAYVLAAVNIVLIFLREIKPRYERLKK